MPLRNPSPNVAMMIDATLGLRLHAKTPEDAVRWCCILEATAPKAGNVFPSRSFRDLTYQDFVEAAEITAECFSHAGRISECMLQAVLKTTTLRRTNVNLGIVLLLGPLVAADRNLLTQEIDVRSPQPRSPQHRSPQIWRAAINDQLSRLDRIDGQNIFRAIASASAGGLGHVDEMDVHAEHTDIDVLAAMRLAAERDQIAKQYACGFSELIDEVLPLLRNSILECGDVLTGICRAHVRLLASRPDSLISRKNGVEAAARVQSLAAVVDLEDPKSLQCFDDALRSPDHKLNPGTTADLIAAGLYLLLRTPAT